MPPILLLPVLLLLSFAAHAAEVKQVSSLPAPEANQAAAADEHFVYAIDSAKVGKYDRATGGRVAVSTGPAHHMNSGFLWEGKLLCAHSNFPQKPEQSQIMALDPATMVLGVFKDFGASGGSLTWVVREGDAWWCTFAFYGAANARTRLVKFDADWKQLAEWTYPPAVISDLGRMSISGGVWHGGQLLTIGHDKRTIYRLRLPAQGSVLELIDTIPCPFPGQGLAIDAKTGELVGIDRDKRQVVFGELKE
ncbi:MAG TPA: hypothetical protein VGO11_23080 [Chthoniobacteraceae bacterium]|jgi:hypothetical protein|nr:hypothetical protein [Chthoniobacteraceae bacterium]